MKITKNASIATAITHSGIFHADEVMATVILSKVFANLTVCRTFRVPESTNAIVYDIGCGKLDHHQRGGNGSRENGVPYAACGLVWRQFGHQLLEGIGVTDVDLVWALMDNSLIEGIDAVDNGFMPQLGDYPASIPSLAGAISAFNPTWDSTDDADDAFMKAVAFAEVVFDNALKAAVSKAKAKVIVEEAIANAEGGIMILERFVPWQEFLFSSVNPKAQEVLFVVFPSNRGGFNWQCVPDVPGGFGQRQAVPTAWRGLTASKLQAVTGVADATFCHPAGFLGSAVSRDGALAMARLAIAS